jgi:hypothetical protein
MDAGLRIRLRFSDCPELAELPWEYLYDRERNRFLCLSDRTPLVRYLEVVDSVRVVPVTPSLRILVVIANPSDLQQLDSEQEWSNVTAALSELTQQGRVEVVRLEEPTLGALHRQLRGGNYHIFHFIGHGAFDPYSARGMLAMEDEHGRARLVAGDDLGMLLHDHRSLRLAVLNSCEGSRGDRSDPFSGTAQSLIQQGIPAVVAMQFEISDDAAITFGHVFYEAIADGYPLDAATAEARKAIYAEGNLTEWGTPVLYLRAPDGRIFDIQDRPTPVLDPSPSAHKLGDRDLAAAQRAAKLVFLCHSSGDKERVRQLCHQLMADGFDCWLDEERLLPGQNWEYEINRAISKSKFVLACLSRNSVTKTGFVQKELRTALDAADRQPEGIAFLIPVRLEECEIPQRLSRWQWVDLFKEGGYERLIHGLKS